MFLAYVKNGQIENLQYYKAWFDSADFTDEQLAAKGLMRVVNQVPYDAFTQKIESVEPFIQDGYVYNVRAVAMTADDIAQQKVQYLNNIRFSRNELLKQSDWTQLADTPVDKAIWATYRQALRDLPQTIIDSGDDPRFFSSFPASPDAKPIKSI